jgi:hypothetical protein
LNSITLHSTIYTLFEATRLTLIPVSFIYGAIASSSLASVDKATSNRPLKETGTA